MKTLVTSPERWNSVHRSIPFVYSYDSRVGSVRASGGFVVVEDLGFIFDFTPVAGEKVYVESGTFIGVHTVASISSGDIITETVSASVTVDVAVVRHIRLPEIKVYSGYLTGESYPTQLPITLVATFTPENSPDNDAQFDVSEYLKSIFRIEPPVEGIDFNMFNRFRLFFDGSYKDFYYVLNSSIKTEDLMSNYIDTNNPLNSSLPPVVFGCGKTIISTLTGNIVINDIVEDADTDTDPDYSSLDYSSDYSIN